MSSLAPHEVALNTMPVTPRPNMSARVLPCPIRTCCATPRCTPCQASSNETVNSGRRWCRRWAQASAAQGPRAAALREALQAGARRAACTHYFLYKNTHE